jgi:uncharacterized protein (DUF305 family)
MPAAALLATLTVGCAPVSGQQPPAEAPRPRAGDADAAFMQGMIVHHQQALEMVALVPERAARDDIRMIAGRIQVSQQDEIAMMHGWLQSHGHAAEDAHHAHGAGHAEMPGMAAPEEMARLAASTGAGFDRLFLELMIRHHQGALVMVEQLFAAGGGQESQVYAIASEVDADQRMEIDRMRAMLQGAPTGARPR